MKNILRALCLLMAWTVAAGATTLLPVDAAELARRADRIFEGDVISVARMMDENHLPVMVVTVHVTDAIKNTFVGETVTFKQIDEMIPGLPRYQPGEHVLLFLAGTSRLGLTAPLGLGQGRFRSARDERDRPTFVNDYNNRELFRNSRALATSQALTSAERQMVGQREGPVERGTFVRFLRRAAAQEVIREQ